MLLTIDIGNTNVVAALYDSDKQVELVRMASDFNFWNGLQGLKCHLIHGVVISSVVPRLTDVFVEACRNLFRAEPLVVTHQNAGLIIDVPEPAQAGADRICNVVAAVALFGAPAVVVDFGTATTYDVIDEAGTFIGGAIAPGIRTSAQYLMESAALLTEAALEIPKTVIGKDTVTNLQAGIMFGAIDEVDGMLVRIQQETRWTDIQVILTGGFSSLISPALKTAHRLAPHLTLEGMRIIYNRNTPENTLELD